MSPEEGGLKFTARHAKRLVTLVVGGSVLLIGIAMLVLPGPALLVIPFGIVILAGEFAWARRWLRRVEALTLRIGGGGQDPEPLVGSPEQGDDPIEQQPQGRDRAE